MRQFAAFALVILSLVTMAFSPRQQSETVVTDPRASYVFGEELTINGAVPSADSSSQYTLFLQPVGSGSRVIAFTPQQDGQFSIDVNLSENPLRAFTTIEYWFQKTAADGQTATSSVNSFIYEDNRFNWQRLDNEITHLAWSSGDLEFGNTLQNTVTSGLEAAQSILRVNLSQPLRIYVYPTAQEMQSAAQLADMPWAAGHASPDLGLILVSIPPGPDARAEMERQLPHEIMHVLEYQAAGKAYSTLPAWLLEGLATSAELYPNPEYQRVLQKAVNEDALIPMSVLCPSFPRDLSGAILAYAQSGSFVRYITQNYGSTAITDLIHRYSDGVNCEAGVQSVIGIPLAQLESRWQEQILGRNAALSAWRQIWPYLLLAGLTLVPLGLSTLLPRRKSRLQREVKS